MKQAIAHLLPGALAVHAAALSVGDATPVDGQSGHWIMLLPKGRFSGRDGRGPYETGDEAQMRAVIAATLARAGSTELVVDYDHQTVFSSVPGVGGRAPAAGWIKEFEVREAGLYGRVEWTETADAAIRAGEYRYISPVYTHDKAGRVQVLTCAGLTNVPNLDLAAVAARSLQHPEPTQDQPMKSLAKAAGLPEDASEADILAAMSALQTANSALVAASGTARPEDAVTAIAAMRAAPALPDPARYVPIEQVVALQQSVAAIQQKTATQETETAVNSAIADGKLPPSMRDWGLALHKSNIQAFTDYTAKAPVLTAVQRASATAPSASADPALDEADLAVMRQMGLTREQMVAAKKGGEA